MPSTYECNACRLTFSVGWYHYHGFESGYGSQTTLVCTACGTMHAVEHPAPDAKVPERLTTLGEPLFLEQVDGTSRPAAQPTWHGNLATEGRTPAQLTCEHCGAAGQLVAAWPESGAPCPNCAAPISEPSQSWIT